MLRLARRLCVPKTETASQAVAYQPRRNFSATCITRHQQRITGDDNGLHSGVVITRNAQKTSIESLIQRIDKIKSNAKPTSSDESALLAILFTPSFAHNALDQRLPLQILSRISESPFENSLDVVTAVVDRLPEPNLPSKNGEEGIGYLFLENSQACTSKSQKQLNPSAQKPGSIEFELLSKRRTPINHRVQLPLAQTVFSTGLVSTLIHTRYDCNKATGEMESQGSRRLESQVFNLPMSISQDSISLQAPFMPLTPLRVVRNSMGNIVRMVSSDTTFEGSRPKATLSASQTASSELEDAVSAYFKSRDMPPEPVSVWALILPAKFAWNEVWHQPTQFDGLKTANSAVIRKLWKPDAEASPILENLPSELLQLLRRGARFTKVLSGGGGWGKKAGLLSLDPDEEYNSRNLRDDEGWEFDFSDHSEAGVEKQQREALGEIVREGESVMFFLAMKDGAPNTERTDLLDRSTGQSVVFGAIPSTIDVVPSHNQPETESDEKSLITHHANFFGALSEGGMAFNLTTENGQVKTKFDVPYGSIRAREYQ
ncbi:Hypothetical protein R9X50_00544500 [Acrodontium crateriforme]|uniref:Uncharacterized protein n=1 Tax=Acrodontium crateriforme TaxID=150365 RepID=A0AAQ3RBI8_9PEZI|nr:Hypothetical protein R9X50_00544500 [Acrodontium crateriforme]